MKRMTHVFIFFAVLYGIITIFFYLFQSALLFFPQPLSSRVELNEKTEEVKIKSSNVNIPLLAFYGTANNIIPPIHSIKLTECWKGEKKLVELSSFGHNDIYGSDQLWEEIDEFLKTR